MHESVFNIPDFLLLYFESLNSRSGYKIYVSIPPETPDIESIDKDIVNGGKIKTLTHSLFNTQQHRTIREAEFDELWNKENINIF